MYIHADPGTRTALKIPDAYDFIRKLCRQQAEVVQNHDNENAGSIGKGEAQHTKSKRLKLGGGQAYGRSNVSLSFYQRHNPLYRA
jgi:hypothetical protein